MADVFLKIVNMSISASWIVLAVLLLRLLLKKAPKWIAVFLWGIVAVRAVCPFSFESVMSLIPSAETISPEIMMDRTPEINSGVSIINGVVNPVIGEVFAPQPMASANPLQLLIPVLAIGWIAGIVAMLVYTVFSYIRVKSKVGTAVLLRDNVYQSENVVSPFVLGMIKPRIYLPFRINGQDMEQVIAHEDAHIRRKDHWWKPIGFLILTLHWFNPLMWLGYVLLCRDIELACDERVVKEFNDKQKADYSQALLSCSVNRRTIAACPLAFGEVGVKNRVRSVLNYKKPAFWIIVVAIAVSATAAVCFLTNPRTALNDELSVFIDMQVAEQNYSEGHTDDNFVVTHHKVLGVREALNKTTVYFWSMYHEYSFENGEIHLESGSHIPTVIVAKRTGSHGHYELVEYWIPGDGADYAKDIKAKFPWYLHGKALDSQRYVEEQTAFCENAAKEYFEVPSSVIGGDGSGLIEQGSISDVGGAEEPDRVVTEIIDRTMTEEIFTDDAEEPFCADEKYIYSFPSIKSEYVIVRFGNGDEMPVKEALEKGLITVAALDRWGIRYYREEHGGELELGEDGAIVRLSSYPEDLYYSTLDHFQALYEQTPAEQVQEKYDNEELVITKMHYYNTQKEWCAEGYTYKYRLEITGRMNRAAKNSTYIILSNKEGITFEQAWKADGYSSLSTDYFKPEDAVIVGHRFFE